MKKIVFKKYKKKNKINYITMSLVICILFMSIGYSVFNSNLMVDNITAVVRPTKDIRVTGANASNLSNQAMIDWVDYNVKSISSSVVLPQQDSTVTFKVQITNIGSIEMGIFSITGLPDNLEYTLSDYQMKDKLCNGNICSLGMQKYITITIKYKENSPVVNSSQPIKLDFDFRSFHKVAYVDFDDGYTSDFPQEVLDGDTFKMTLKQPYPVGAKPFIGGVGVAYHYEGDTLVVDNTITTDLEIRSNYISSIEDLVALSVKTGSGNSYDEKEIYLEKSLDFNNRSSYRNADRMDFGNYNNDAITESLYNELTNKAGYGFVPIGIGATNGITNRFNGNFDGKNYTISNLYINALDHHSGLFGLVGKTGSTNEIVNLTLTGQITKSGTVGGHVGGIVASTSASYLKIENVHNYANLVNNSNNGGIMGGIVAYASENLDIFNCTNYGEIYNTFDNYTGGLVGWSNSTSDKLTRIYNSHNFGPVTNNSNINGGDLGGLIASSSQRLIINNSHNEGKLTAAHSQYVGGLLGYGRNNVCVMNSYNIGDIVAKNSTMIGGFFVNTISNIFIINSYNGGNITGTNIGGLFYTGNSSPNIYLNNIFNSGDLSGTRNYEVFYSVSHGSISANKVYYKEENLTASNVTNINLISKTAVEMQSNVFVEELNNNINNIDKDELKAKLKSINLIDDNFQMNFSKWKLGENGYPTLDIG